MIYRVLQVGCLVFIAACAHAQEYRIYIDPSSAILVHGSTNANKFTFKYTEAISLNNAVHVVRKDRKLILSGGVIKLKVKSFDSGNNLMNSDFRKMLKEPENPFIQVELATIIPAWKPEEVWLEGDVEIVITLNNISKKFQVKGKVENPGSILIYGKQKLLLTDFKLQAPTRMMGLVKVRDVVEFDFALRFDTDR
jgi:hypothetical protein